MDNLYPSRIIIGGDCERSRSFAKLLVDGAKTKNIQPTFVTSSDAEAIKLFSNTFLAMRIAFFNELDSFAMVNSLNAANIIEGVSSDPRIGRGYNNPSFGYGGYCLPKDTKQLLANYKKVPQALIQAIIASNSSRKDFISEQIALKDLKTIGFYRLVMKANSDNFRTSAVIGIMERLKKKGMEIIIYEPLIQDKNLFNDFELFTDLEAFKARSDLIVTNRKSSELDDVESKLFTRDIFGEN
jgi:UDPglucose 6-dehydrogenase